MPVPVYNAFNTVFDNLDSYLIRLDGSANVEWIPRHAFNEGDWPAEPGDYRVFDYRKSIALAMLAGVEIEGNHRPEISSVLAIAGRLDTENIGVEHVVKNLIANPYIRHLIVWGEDVKGHHPGDALRNLQVNGVDATGRIIGARGGRPVLINLAAVEIDHFRKQIEVHSLAGTTTPEELAIQIAKLELLNVPPYEAGLSVNSVAPLKAEPAKRLRLDPAGYFVVMVMKGRASPLVVEHYRNDGRLAHIVEGADAATVCATLIEKGLVSRMDHAAYIGRELSRAEMSLPAGWKYIQDRAQGEI